MGSALPIAIGARRLSIRASDRKIRAINIARLIFLLFSATWKIPWSENDRRKRQAFWTVEGKVMGGNAWGGGGGGVG